MSALEGTLAVITGRPRKNTKLMQQRCGKDPGMHSGQRGGAKKDSGH